MVEIVRFFLSSLAGTAATSEFADDDIIRGFIASASGEIFGPLGEIGVCILIADVDF